MGLERHAGRSVYRRRPRQRRNFRTGRKDESKRSWSRQVKRPVRDSSLPASHGRRSVSPCLFSIDQHRRLIEYEQYQERAHADLCMRSANRPDRASVARRYGLRAKIDPPKPSWQRPEGFFLLCRVRLDACLIYGFAHLRGGGDFFRIAAPGVLPLPLKRRCKHVCSSGRYTSLPRQGGSIRSEG